MSGLPQPNVRPNPTDTFGCGIDFQNRSLFFTYNGRRMHAYGGVFPDAIPNDSNTINEDPPKGRYDVFAAIGVQGASRFQVNFGTKEFVWKEGNQPQWKVENHIGKGQPPEYA